MVDETFEARQKRLIEEWERGATSTETQEEIGLAIIDLFIKRERIRRRVETPSPERDLVDHETIAQLRDARSLGPEFSRAEAAFRRLVADPAAAIRYLEEAQKNFSKSQSQAAKKPRPKSQDSITKLINSIVEEMPTISAKEVGRKLEVNEDVQFDGGIGEYVHIDDRSCLKEKNLDSRVSAAKKRVSG